MVCRGIDVYTYGHGPDFHYIWPHADIDTEQKKVPVSSDTRYGANKLYDIQCRNCPNRTWGHISQWKGGPELAVLKCTAFTFRHRDNEMKTFKKWKLVPFVMQHYGEVCEQGGFEEPLDLDVELAT